MGKDSQKARHSTDHGLNKEISKSKERILQPNIWYHNLQL